MTRPKYYSRTNKKPNQSYRLYDPEITSIEERVRQALTFKSARDIKIYLGMSDYKNKKLNEYCDPLLKKRYYSEKLGKSFIIRKLKGMHEIKT